MRGVASVNRDDACAVSSAGAESISSAVLDAYHVQDVRLERTARRVWRADDEILLSRKEVDLLHYLIARAGQAVVAARAPVRP